MFQRFFLPLTLTLAVALTAAAAMVNPQTGEEIRSPANREGGEHRHGHGYMEMELEGAMLEIALQVPAADLMGFGHRPRSEEQFKTAISAISLLRNSDRMFTLTDTAQCASSETDVAIVELSSGEVMGDEVWVREGANLPEVVDDADEPPGHAEVVVNYRFDCGDVPALYGVTVHYFETFPSAETLAAVINTPHGEFEKTLDQYETVVRDVHQAP